MIATSTQQIFNASRSNRPEKKVPAQQTDVQEEAKLAQSSFDKNLDPVKIAYLCQDMVKNHCHIEAQNQIGLFFLQTPPDNLSTASQMDFYLEAFRNFSLAAEGGNPEALNNLGYMYEKGLGIDRNMESAKKYYKRSADKGLETGKFNFDRLSNQHLEGKENIHVQRTMLMMQDNSHVRRAIEIAERSKTTITNTTSSNVVENRKMPGGDNNMSTGRSTVNKSRI